MMSLLLDLCQKYGVELKKVATTRGGEWQGPCPGCGGDDRFHVHPEVGKDREFPGTYWCRQCGKKGDTIQFLIDFEGLTFVEACARLGKPLDSYYNRRPPKQAGPGPCFQPRQYEAPAEIWQAKALKLVQWSYEKLYENEDWLNYLTGRGISETSVDRFYLGYNPGDDHGRDLFRSREGWGLSVIESEKGGRPRALWLPKGWVVPWFGRNGTVARIRIRRPKPVEFGPAYYLVPGSSMETMIIRAFKPSGIFLVVESELDAFMVSEKAGDLVHVVATGSSSARPDEKSYQELAGGLVLNALDFDQAGAREVEWWKANFKAVKRWPVPKGKDPGEAYQAGVDIRQWVLEGLPEGMRRIKA